MALLSKQDAAANLTLVPLWQRVGDSIKRDFIFVDFVAAMAFVNRVAEAAEKAGHHPDIDIRWNKARLVLTSHDAGGLTELDFDLARTIDSLV